MVSGNSMTIEQLTAGITNLGGVVESAFGVITAAPVLTAIFAAGVLGIGFRIIHQAKNF